MLKRRTRKLSKSMVSRVQGRHTLLCRECNQEEIEVSGEIVSVVCAYCVQKWIAPPVNYKKEKSDKPRGWHFKAFFEHEGVVYSKGEIVTDEDEIKSLRKLHGKVVKTKKPTQKKRIKKEVSVKKSKKTVSKRGTKNVSSTK